MRAFVFGAMALLGACASAPAAETPAPEPDTCGIARFAHLIGSPADAIDRAALPARTRIIAPNQPVTMDYSAERLNIMTDAAGRIVEMRCF